MCMKVLEATYCIKVGDFILQTLFSCVVSVAGQVCIIMTISIILEFLQTKKMDADDLPSLPLSLQDMCMLCIMLRLEEFPTDSLALLPSAIRRRIFLGLAHADLLHVDTEVLFGDLNYLGYDPSREDHRQRGPAVAREELLNVFFQGPNSTFFSLNFEAALDCYQPVKSTHDDGEFDLIEHICKCYLSLEPTMVPLSYKDVFVLPKRFLQFVSLYWKHDHRKLHVPLEMAQPLLTYCKMQCAPQNLKIDCFSFWNTMLLEEEYACLEKIKERYALLEKKTTHNSTRFSQQCGGT